MPLTVIPDLKRSGGASNVTSAASRAVIGALACRNFSNLRTGNHRRVKGLPQRFDGLWPPRPA
jgi:hypothetical protein